MITDVAATDQLHQRDLVATARSGMGIRDHLGALAPVDQRVTWYSAFLDSFEAMIGRGTPRSATTPP